MGKRFDAFKRIFTGYFRPIEGEIVESSYQDLYGPTRFHKTFYSSLVSVVYRIKTPKGVFEAYDFTMPGEERQVGEKVAVKFRATYDLGVPLFKVKDWKITGKRIRAIKSLTQTS